MSADEFEQQVDDWVTFGSHVEQILSYATVQSQRNSGELEKKAVDNFAYQVINWLKTAVSS